jgi:O-antigen/teichoic acid export membrane protein
MMSLRPILNSRLIKGSAVYLLSNIVSAAIPFALLPVLTRYLSPAEYGEVGMFQTLVSALAAFVGLTAVGAVSRKYFDVGIQAGELGEFVGSCFLVLAASAVLVFVGVFIFEQEISRQIGLVGHWVLVSVAVAAANFVIQMRLGIWQVQNKPVLYGMLQLGQSMANMVLSLVLVVGLLQGAEGRLEAQIFASFTFAALSVYILFQDDLIVFRWRPDHIKEILYFGIPLIPHVAGIFLLGSFDRFVVTSKLGLAEAGIYVVAVQLASVIGIILDAISKAYVPWLYERLKRDVPAEKCAIVRWTYLYFVGVLGMAGLAFLIGPGLAVFIAGEGYADAGKVVGWLALGQAFIGMYLMVTNYTFYSRRTGMLSLATIASGILNVGLLLVLVDRAGLFGAAVAFAISMAVRFLLVWRVAQTCHPMPWFSFTKAT